MRKEVGVHRLDNTETNRQAYRQLLLTTPGLGEYISGAILFEETLYQSTTDGKKFVDCLRDENIVPGIKVDKGLDGLASDLLNTIIKGLVLQNGLLICHNLRTVVSIPCGPSALAVKEAAWGLAPLCCNFSEVFYYLAENNVTFEGILLKPSMVTPGAEHKEKASPDTIANYTLTMLRRRVPPAVPGIMFLSGGQSEVEATLNLNAMNQSPNPWHAPSLTREHCRTPFKTWQGRPKMSKLLRNHFWCVQKANSPHNSESTAQARARRLKRECLSRAIHTE
ncbi:hypothetical protein DH2020_011877 [Rehmannia glutinosa]|uniref:Fructose-bisphosphate aldolase n=1 Tax=Rehmannia glutinosa TaxID=99300 RepID=A0ABR0XES0_REHGL